MRQLASIQRIRALEPIEGADAILRASVLGWQLVVKKDEFSIGDLCVYCEIDSLMPERPEFEFLKPRGMRIRTVRLRGQVSQGICFPLSILPTGTKIEEGADVTETLGIVKYEPPIPASLAGVAKGAFPSFIPKTDETRVQVLQELLDKYVGESCFITEKLDGSSVTYYLRNGEFGVCSRNLELLETPENTLWKMARALGIEEKLRAMGLNLALQGELIGEGIQGNKYRLKGQHVFFFNVFDIERYQYFDYADWLRLTAELEISPVPVIMEQFPLTNSIPELVHLSAGRSTLYDVQREGIVIRPHTERQDLIGRVSFKAINPEFLLKFGE